MQIRRSLRGEKCSRAAKDVSLQLQHLDMYQDYLDSLRDLRAAVNSPTFRLQICGVELKDVGSWREPHRVGWTAVNTQYQADRKIDYYRQEFARRV